MDGIWDMEHNQFIPWQDIQVKFRLLHTKIGDWELITSLVMHEWYDILEMDRKTWCMNCFFFLFFQMTLHSTLIVFKIPVDSPDQAINLTP